MTDEEDQALLSPEEREEIEAELQHYPSRQSGSIDAMKIVQRHRGWISDENLRDIAEFLGMSAGDLDGIATFYNLIYRKPVGRHIITFCDSVSCWIMGCDRVREHLCSRLKIKPGETTADGRFTLLPIVCLGACDHAPVLMVNDDLHHDVDAVRLDAILENYK